MKEINSRECKNFAGNHIILFVGVFCPYLRLAQLQVDRDVQKDGVLGSHDFTSFCMPPNGLSATKKAGRDVLHITTWGVPRFENREQTISKWVELSMYYTVQRCKTNTRTTQNTTLVGISGGVHRLPWHLVTASKFRHFWWFSPQPHADLLWTCINLHIVMTCTNNYDIYCWQIVKCVFSKIGLCSMS